MSILDDAIREHLELKRAHGADEAELKKLEDEAFGPPQRPDEVDSSAEAPTEFLTAPSEVVEEAAAGAEDGARRLPNIADLQEAPPAPKEDEADSEALEPEEPAIEEQPAGEHEVIPDAGAHSTEEREAIADQPTEMFDVQAEIESEPESPSDEELIDASASAEPRLTPVEPPPEPAAEEPEPHDDDDDDFFSEQRLSEELDNALEAPVTDEHAVPEQHLPPLSEEAPSEPAPRIPIGETEEGTALYNLETETESEGEDSGEEEDSGESNAYEPETGSHDDVLEDTPEFLEDAPDADDAWFEQRPPKDFDFDD